MPEFVWPLDLLSAGANRYFFLGYVPLPGGGCLNVYSISEMVGVEHVASLSEMSNPLWAPRGFEIDRRSGDLLTVWREREDQFNAAWLRPRR